MLFADFNNLNAGIDFLVNKALLIAYLYDALCKMADITEMNTFPALNTHMEMG